MTNPQTEKAEGLCMLCGNPADAHGADHHCGIFVAGRSDCCGQAPMVSSGGSEAERAAIVAYLRERAELCTRKRQPSWAAILASHADAIENGAHTANQIHKAKTTAIESNQHLTREG